MLHALSKSGGTSGWNEGMTSVGVCLQCGVVGYLLEEEEERRHQDHLSVWDERLLSNGLHHRSCQLSDRAVVSRSVLCCHTNTVVRWLSAFNTYSFSPLPPWRGSFLCGLFGGFFLHRTAVKTRCWRTESNLWINPNLGRNINYVRLAEWVDF